MNTSEGGFEFFDHTGDIGVRLEGATPSAIFAAGARALTDSVTDLSRVEPRREIGLDLESAALDLLLVDFLAELVYRFDVDQFIAANAEVTVGTAAVCRLHATVHGETFDPGRHPSKVLIKAVTYHALEFRHDAGGYHATVVFDI